MAELAGPKIGDARSLWNFTPSPGWTKDEAATLRLCLMKLGIGRWQQIVDSGVLPGKQIQQLNGQTQRLLGQQSLAEFTNMKVDVDAIRAANLAKTGTEVYRKNGLITNQGGKLKPEALKPLRAENLEKYGLTEAQVDEITLPDPPSTKTLGADAYMGKNHNKGGIAGRKSMKRTRVDDIMTVDVDALPSKASKVALLTALRRRLVVLTEFSTKPSPEAKKVLKETTAQPEKKTATKKKRTSGENAVPNADGAVKNLVQMGFDVKKAKDAVDATGGDVQDCVNWLVANM